MYLPIEKNVDRHLTKFESLLHKSLIEIGQIILEWKVKIWKVYKQMDRWMDKQTMKSKWSEKLIGAANSCKLKWRKYWMIIP